jgi:hypothetical protein
MNPMFQLTDSLSEMLGDFQNNITYQVKSKVTPEVTHNHLPVRFIVKGCKYCEKYGNVFTQQCQDIQEL